MTFAFDLISDLHVDSEPLDWSHQATSPICVVAGDVARDRDLLVRTLRHLGQCYQAVFYIDGNEEHRNTLNDLDGSYQTLIHEISGIPNVTYLHDHVVIMQGVAFVATNGWYSFNHDPRFTVEYTQEKIQEYYGINSEATTNILKSSVIDARYLESTLNKLQTHLDVKCIVIVTHFVPHGKFLSHDPDMADSHRINASVNSFMAHALRSDTENKTKLWCFGHYHHAVDTWVDGIRYVCNPRGRAGTRWYHNPYHAQRIEL